MFIHNWKLNFTEQHGIPCTAPCSMYQVLYDNGIIPDPFDGINELALTKLSDEDCTFTSVFTLSEEEYIKKHIELIFHGLDTICDIFLNDILLASVKNMHRSYEFDIKPYLTSRENTIRLEFKSPLAYFKKWNAIHDLWSVRYLIKGSPHLRKALYMSGWDWAPKLPDMGIFRPVEVRAYNTDKFTDIEIRQLHKNGLVTLCMTAETKYGYNKNITAEIDGETVPFINGKAMYTVKNPKLWWPNGYGEQQLYPIHFSLYHDGKVIDTEERKLGLRTLTLSTAKDQNGSEFCFVVNGVQIFAMGANYVPLDSLVSRITLERIKAIIDSAKFANFNCLRVWGGGYYPEDEFYDYCDEAGLIVWQDFMVACINIWMRREFEEEFTAEAIENVKRIRHHACLGLLCGNNEMEDALLYWADGSSMLTKIDYLKLYEQVLPEICMEYAPDTFYLPSSPTSGGGFDDPRAYNRGDTHYWEVWSQSKPLEEYRKHKFRFCSEYGFESFPSMKTIDTFCKKEDQNVLSYVMEHHQKYLTGTTKILSYISGTYLYPEGTENVVYASQLMQAQAIQYAVEHFRRNRGYCMGSLYWQLNDCWPVASWSSIDYYGRYKALHYFAKKFYAPVAIGLFAENGAVTVNLANETMTAFRGTLKVSFMKNDFETLFADKKEISVSSLASEDIAVYPASYFKNSRDTYFFAELYDENGELIMRKTELCVKPKNFIWKKPSITVNVEQKEDGVLFSFTSDILAKNVEVDFKTHDIILSDNYFDIADKEPVRIFAKTAIPAEELMRDMTLRTVYDISHT